MIESKILSDAPGIQNQGLIDKTEGTSLPAMTNAVIVGRFKRGRMDKPFKVSASNYKALLGHDPSNPSYLAVEDVFKAGVSEVGILRVSQFSGGSLVSCTPTDLEFSHYLLNSENPPSFEAGAHGRFRVDGGVWVDYENTGGYWSDVLAAFIGAIPVVDNRYNGLGRLLPFHFIPDRWTGGYLAGSPDIDREGFEYIRPDSTFGATIPSSDVTEIKPATIDFVTSSGLGLDIVAVMLGGNKTATACAYAEWHSIPE